MPIFRRILFAASLLLPAAGPGLLAAKEPATAPASVIAQIVADHDSAGAPQNVTVLPFGVAAAQGNGSNPAQAAILNILMAPKQVKASYVGIVVDSADQVVQSQLKLFEGVGLVIKNVEPDSPAQAAGLQQNDVLTQFADQIIINPEHSKCWCGRTRPAKTSSAP